MVVEGPTPGIGDFAINDAYSSSCGQCHACRQVSSGQAQELSGKIAKPRLGWRSDIPTTRLLGCSVHCPA